MYSVRGCSLKRVPADVQQIKITQYDKWMRTANNAFEKANKIVSVFFRGPGRTINSNDGSRFLQWPYNSCQGVESIGDWDVGSCIRRSRWQRWINEKQNSTAHVIMPAVRKRYKVFIMEKSDVSRISNPRLSNAYNVWRNQNYFWHYIVPFMYNRACIKMQYFCSWIARRG